MLHTPRKNLDVLPYCHGSSIAIFQVVGGQKTQDRKALWMRGGAVYIMVVWDKMGVIS